MAVRKATQKETQEIVKHSLDVLKEATLGHVEPSLEKALHMVTPTLDNGGYYLIYIENHIIRGWIGIGILCDFYANDEVGVILELYVLPPYRKQGIAKKLCEEAFIEMKEMGWQKVQLNVFFGNNAKFLYKKLGFREVYTMMEKEL